MVDIVDVRHAVYDQLVAANLGVTLVGPNEDATPSFPYIIVDAGIATPSRPRLDGVCDYLGNVYLQIVVRPGTTETVSSPIEKAIIAAFPTGFDLGGGAIVSMRPVINGVMADKGAYVTQVTIPYRAHL